MLERTKRISFKISFFSSKEEPEPDLYTGSVSSQIVPAQQHWLQDCLTVPICFFFFFLISILFMYRRVFCMWDPAPCLIWVWVGVAGGGRAGAGPGWWEGGGLSGPAAPAPSSGCCWSSSSGGGGGGGTARTSTAPATTATHLAKRTVPRDREGSILL